MEEAGRLQSMGSQRVGDDLTTKQQQWVGSSFSTSGLSYQCHVWKVVLYHKDILFSIIYSYFMASLLKCLSLI